MTLTKYRTKPIGNFRANLSGQQTHAHQRKRNAGRRFRRGSLGLDMKAQKKLTHILFPDIFHKIRFAYREIEMTATDLLFTLPFNKAKANSFQVLFS